jgi:5-methylcytosine-specific restriction endonuclease McrA
MDYQKIYKSFIESRKELKRNLEYSERHHIIPKSLGGKDIESNIVTLTPREHFFAHLLLYNFAVLPEEKHKMSCAISFLRHGNDNSKNVLNSRKYDIEKRIKSKNQSKFMENYWEGKSKEEKKKLLKNFAGMGHLHWTEESHKKASESAKKRVGEKNSFFGKTHSKKQKEKWSNERRGKIPWNKGKTGLQKCSEQNKETFRKLGKSMSKRIWMNDGIKSFRILRDDVDQKLREGLVQGMLKK